jgi:hypothetical protein
VIAAVTVVVPGAPAAVAIQEGLERTGGRRMTRRWWTAVAILLAGWTAAGVVYATTPPADENAEVDEMFHSRRYVLQLERMGGKASVFANDVREWMASLWAGRNRAYTIVIATALVAGVYLLWTRPGRPPMDIWPEP